jgi:hypothetical protein
MVTVKCYKNNRHVFVKFFNNNKTFSVYLFVNYNGKNKAVDKVYNVEGEHQAFIVFNEPLKLSKNSWTKFLSHYNQFDSKKSKRLLKSLLEIGFKPPEDIRVNKSKKDLVDFSEKLL